MRESISQEYKWRLEDIFESDEAFEKAFQELLEKTPKLLEYKGKLNESSKTLLEGLNQYKKISIDLMELYAYAKMNKDLDNKNTVYQAMFDKMSTEYFNIASMTAFFTPELSSLEREKIQDWITKTPKLKEYAHYLDDILRNKKHILTEREEQLLAGIGPAIESVSDAFSMLNDVELDFGVVIKDDNQEVKLTHGSFGALKEDPSRSVREQAYKNIHTPYKTFGNTISAIYLSSVKSDVFFAKTRNFKSCMSRAMFSDGLPEKIYTNLIETIRDNLPAYYKYLELRKEILGLDKLHIYDLSVPIVDGQDKIYDFEEAKKILSKGLAPLGTEYVKDIQTLFNSRAIDVFETPGKTSGAYAWGTYKTHPYMLLNWSKKLDDVFTFAHETGHCMHSYYSNKNQSYINSHYPIFLAEIASTVNENVLLSFLLDKCDVSTKEGKTEKAALLNHYLDGVKGTVIRQTMFAEFELKVHEMVEYGQAVTSDTLSKLYGQLLELYFGEDVVIDEYMTWEWARIPHFYNSFYVYKYATGFCAAALITKKLFTDPQAPSNYIKFLSSGGSDYPANLLKIVGVDMTKQDAIVATMDLFQKRVTELEEILLDLKSN